ncbi:MAG: hypothetical protein RQ735_00555 [Flavobacteriaceae bacterium]|nr:hypothetical protein [Flavobacteriaceae bacterium]
MENKNIRIALSSVLIYLIFKNAFQVLTELLLWIHLKLSLVYEYVFVLFNSMIGVLSLLLLVFLFNRFLKKENPKNKTIYALILITATLKIALLLMNKISVNKLAEVHVDGALNAYLSQFGWSKLLDVVFPIFGLIYFLWKLKTGAHTEKSNL